MKTDELKKASLELMEISEAAYLTTIDQNGFPFTRAMLNLRNKEQFPPLAEMFGKHNSGFLIYFTTSTSSSKIVQIKANPNVSVYYCNPEEFHGLMLSGRIEIDTDPAIGKTLWQDGWEKFYPEGADDPDYTVLRLLPNLARGWYQAASFEFKMR